MGDDQRIVIRKGEGGGFTVAPDPFVARRMDLTVSRSTLEEALRYATSLKIVKGWPVIDLSGGVQNGRSL